MKRPSKKEIREAVDRLKEKSSGGHVSAESDKGKLSPKKATQRIRKQGV